MSSLAKAPAHADGDAVNLPYRLGVVIPGYGHPQFLAEALQSVVAQKGVLDIKAVVVDDGCRFAETGYVAQSFMTHDDIYFVRQANTRLPGARNTGVRFLLDLDPDLDAIFFLDADNRLSPHSLATYAQLLFADEGTGWAFPDIYFFGLNSGQAGFDIRATTANYSGLKHLMGNVSEAGSLVRADVFRKGLFFDETMTSGFEDWDFWLTLLEAGYEGVRVADAGFFYRRRPESMLVDSRRLEDALLLRLQQNHKTLFQPRKLMQRAHKEGPRYALYTGGDDVHLFADPMVQSLHSWDKETFRQRLKTWQRNPGDSFFPRVLITISEAVWQRLLEQRTLLRWLFWRIDETSGDTPLAIELAEGDAVAVVKGGAADSVVDSHIAWTPTASLGNTFYTQDAPARQAAIATLPNAVWPSGRVEPLADAWLNDLIATGPLPASPIHREHRYAGPDARGLDKVLIEPVCAVEGRCAFPVASPAHRILIAVREEECLQETTQTRLLALAAQCKDANADVTLLMEYDRDFRPAKVLQTPIADYLSDIMGVLRHRRMGNAPYYLGRRLSQYQTDVDREDGSVLAKAADVLVSLGSASFASYFGEARQSGIPGYIWLPDGIADIGSDADRLLSGVTAFEHAVTAIIGPTTTLVPMLAAEGVPAAKVITLEQAMQAWFSSGDD